MFCTRGSESAELGNWLLLPEHYDLIVISMPAVLVLLGLLMISNVPYPHFVIALAKRRHSMSFLVGAVVVVAIAAVEWQLAMVTVTTGYVLWGMALGFYRVVFVRRKHDDNDSDDADVPSSHLSRSVPSRD
jgi:phosphatidylserine synthase